MWQASGALVLPPPDADMLFCRPTCPPEDPDCTAQHAPVNRLAKPLLE